VPWPSGKKDEDYQLAKSDFSKLRMVRQKTWLNAGGFTESLASHLTGNAFRGRDDVTFEELHPDFMGEIYHAKANPLGASRLTAKESSLSVSGAWEVPKNELYQRQRKDQGGKILVKLVKSTEAPDSGMMDIVIRARVSDAKDESSDVMRFTSDQVRLFGREKQGGPLKMVSLFGINDDSAKQAANRLVQVYPGEPFARPEGEIDFVFRVKSEFEPVFLEFKQDARAEVNFDRDPKKPKLWEPIGTPKPKTGTTVRKSTPPAEGTDSTPGGSSSDAGATAETGTTGNTVNRITPGAPGGRSTDYGRVAVLGPAQGIAVSSKLPFEHPLTTYGGQSEITSGTVKNSRTLIAELDNNWAPIAGNQPPAEKFDVPADQRLVQISVEKLQAGSTYGQALAFARENIGDFYMKDAKGNDHRPVGVYAMADINGKKTFELLYLDATERDFARLPKLNRIHGTDLKGDYALVYLFIVPVGTEPTEVHTGGHPVDLKQFHVKVQ
jgi:hypothetical protein